MSAIALPLHSACTGTALTHKSIAAGVRVQSATPYRVALQHSNPHPPNGPAGFAARESRGPASSMAAASMTATVRTKPPPGRSWLLGRGGAALRPASRSHLDDGYVRVKRAPGLASLPEPRQHHQGILPFGVTSSDEFAVRLAAWLADVAMNGRVTA